MTTKAGEWSIKIAAGLSGFPCFPMFSILVMTAATFYIFVFTHKLPLGVSFVIEGGHLEAFLFRAVLIAFDPVWGGRKDKTVLAHMFRVAMGAELFSSMIAPIFLEALFDLRVAIEAFRIKDFAAELVRVALHTTRDSIPLLVVNAQRAGRVRE